MSKIFISYSHDSEKHTKCVLSFANQLAKDGIDCILDQYIEAPPEGWTRWMEKNIKDAEFVLMVCTQTYYNRVTGKEKTGKGLGIKWEGKLIYKYIYYADSINDKFIPVLFDTKDKIYIPDPLKDYTYYTVTSEKGYKDLHRRITHQPKTLKPTPGTKKRLPPEEVPNFFETKETTSKPIKIETTKLPTTSSILFGREKELEILDKAWENPHTKIISFIAWGGIGKTALVNAWLNRMEKENYRGAQLVYGWSFYSQGTKDDRQASSDKFMNDALKWFGYKGEKPPSQYEKGRLLAEIISKRKTLLVLDGLEPLQYPPGEMQGYLKDQAMQALLKGLARSHNGVCIITSRCKVEDIKSTEGKTTLTYEVENLGEDTGIKVLKNYGIKGRDNELKKVVKEFKGHALALNLIGSYLKTVHDGDIRKRDLIPALTEDEKQGGHARRVMKSYEKWFAESNKAELDILYVLGLFDRPASKEAIDVLKEKSAIRGLTDRLEDLSYPQWQRALEHLRDLRLMAKKDQNSPHTIDCHPLVREHFGEKLKSRNPKAWKEAHLRLYEYYKNLPEKLYGKYLPDTLEEMEPLFAAVMHGCLAGKHQEALIDVYWERIRRKQEAYTVKKLGAFGADLACLSSFFESLWDRPAPGLSEEDKALVLSETGFALRAVGRLGEAFQPMKAGLEMHIKQKDWKDAAEDANNLSELLLTLGNMKEAEKYGKQSVKFANRSGDGSQMVYRRTTLADVHYQTGRIKEAENLFVEAKDIRKQRQPEYPYLYSLSGFRYCDLLISSGKYRETMERAKTTLKYKNEGWYTLLAIALDTLTIGRALMLQSIQDKSEDFSEVENYLRQAVDGLRKAGQQQYLPCGLLARAALYRLQKNFTQSWIDLDEAREIVEYGKMRLYLADYFLEVCRNIKSQLAVGNWQLPDNSYQIKKLTEEFI